MKIKFLTVSNFGSLGEEVKIDFDLYEQDDKILVIGENRDSAGSDSNGSGKSTIFNAITWAIFGKVPNNMDVTDIIRRGEKEAKVTLTLGDEEKEIIVIRKRTRKTQELSFYVNGENLSKRTTQQTQQTLLHYFGILENNKYYFADFLNTTYFSINALKAFAGKDSTPKERLDLIARFLNLELLDKCTNRAKIYANQVKTDITTIQGQLEFLRDKMESNSSVEEMKNSNTGYKLEIDNFKVKNKQAKIDLEAAEQKNQLVTSLEDLTYQIERLDTEKEEYISLLSSQIEEYQSQLQTCTETEAKIEKLKTEIGETSFNDLNHEVVTLREHLSKGKEKVSKVQQEYNYQIKKIQETQKQIDETLTCPHCNKPLMIIRNDIEALDIEILRKRLISQEEEREVIKGRWETLNKKVEKFEEQVETKSKELNELVSKENELKILNENLTSLLRVPEKILDLETKKEEKEESHQEYKQELTSKKLRLDIKLKKFAHVDESLIPALEENIEQNNKLIQQLKEEIARNEVLLGQIKEEEKKLKKLKKEEEKLLTQLSDCQFWVEGFPQIRTWMIESFLPSFEEQVNIYLNKMEVGMRVRFQTFKEKKSKKSTTDKYKYEFNIEIIDENNNKRGLETFSAGESKRIGVAVGFALRELTLTRGYNAFEFLLLDEIVDSLDETGILEFFDLLNIISGVKFVVSHNSSLKTRFSKVMKVTKESGKSTIAQLT